MEPTSLSQVSQGNGQLNGQSQNGHPNGYGVQKHGNQVKEVGDKNEWPGVPVVAVNGDHQEDRSLKSVTPLPSSSSSLPNGSEPAIINGSQQPPVPNMQPVHVDSPAAPTSISAALAPPSPPPPPVSSPVTPTPSSMSFMFHQLRHPSHLDLTTHPSSLEVPSSIQSPESTSNSNTPKVSSAALLSSSGGSKEDQGVDGREGEKGDEGNHQGTQIVIPDSSTLGMSSTTTDPTPLSSTSTSNSNPSNNSTTSRPTSTSIDPTLFSNRPAPPSPAMSRRVSGAPSTASTSSSPHSRSSRPPSLAISRTRMSGVGSDAKRQSLGTQLNQFMMTADVGGINGDGGSITPIPKPITSSSPLASPHKLAFTQSQVNNAQIQQATSSTHSPSVSSSIIPTSSDPIPTPTPTPTATTTFSKPPQPSSTTTPPPPPLATTVPAVISHVYIKIRDFAFAPTDERHLGLGTDVPKANKVHRLNRKLGGPDRAKARAAAAAAASLDPSSSTAGAGRSGLGSRRTDSIGSMGSVDSSDAGAAEEEGEDEGWGIGISGWGKGGGGGKGWDGFRMGMGRFSWTIGSNIRSGNDDAFNNNNKNDNNDDSKETPSSSSLNGIFPSRKDLDMNFMDSSSSSSDDDDDDNERRGRGLGFTEEFPTDYYDDDDYGGDDGFDGTGLRKSHEDGEDGEYVVGADAEEEEDGEDGEEELELEPLYPGLYRALYAFEPEGTAEMKLDEDQIVRVVGRGGGVGWAVVVVVDNDNGNGKRGDGDGGGVRVGVALPKHALVPEGYLEAVRLDWEDELEEEGLVLDGEAVVDADADAIKPGDDA